MPKVLLVDDEPAILESTAALLAEMGYEVITVARADLIIQTAKAEHPDLLLQDIRMPGLDLHALVDELRADPALASLPVLLFSASIEIQDIADRVGAASHVEKPFEPDDLMAAIQGALALPVPA